MRLVLAASLGLTLATATAPSAGRAPTADPGMVRSEDLVGSWTATLEHEGATTAFALEIERAADGKLTSKATIPAMHASGVALGTAMPVIEGYRVRLGPFDLRYDPQAGTLDGVVPEGLAPVYRIPLVLRRVARIAAPARAGPAGRLARPVWTFDAGSALWAGPRYDAGVVYVGGQDGHVLAIEAASGRKLWSQRLGGAIRTRPTRVGGDVYVQADDGVLYALSASLGAERWRTRVAEKPIERLPFEDPRSRYDRFGADVTAANGCLLLGTHDGAVIALDPASGAVRWRFATGDAVLAAPAVDSGRVYAGSFDGGVYALDEATGRLLWRRDTGAAVVSTPALAEGRVIVGNRAYDVVALDASSGEIAWKQYVWFSWIESSASVRDGVAYVGSSDAASVSAFEVRSGRRLWTADVFGWAWGQPAVTETRVYMGTSSQAGYPAGHRAGVTALDRGTGAAVWRFEAPASASGAFGFPGSAAVGGGLVYVSGLDGRVLAFPE